MIPLIPALFAVGLAACGIACLVYSVRNIGSAVGVARATPTDALSIAAGDSRVCVVGAVAPLEDPVPAPFSDDDCVLVDYAVEEFRSQGKTSGWEQIDEGSAGVPFTVDAGGAAVRVDPSTATFALGDPDRLVVDGGTEPPARIERFIELNDDIDCQAGRLSLGIIDLATGNDRRYTQRCVRAGDEISVVGDATEYPAAGVGQAKIRLRGGSPFVISDATPNRTALRLAGAAIPALVLGVGFLAGAGFLAAAAL
ncbi:hypothetical protein ACNS7O_08515 [Haloferacaceae archaeon DSL9]